MIFRKMPGPMCHQEATMPRGRGLRNVKDLRKTIRRQVGDWLWKSWDDRYPV